MHMDEHLKDMLAEANLYFTLAKKYEYVDPQKHFHYYQKYFPLVGEIEKHYLKMEHHRSATPNMYYSQFSQYPM